MASDPIDKVAELLGDVVGQMEAYSDIAMQAARRNARQEYDADALLADAQQVWRLVVKDVARFTATVVDALGAAEVVVHPADGEEVIEGSSGEPG